MHYDPFFLTVARRMVLAAEHRAAERRFVVSLRPPRRRRLLGRLARQVRRQPAVGARPAAAEAATPTPPIHQPDRA